MAADGSEDSGENTGSTGIIDKEQKFQDDMDSIFKYISAQTYPESMKRDSKKDFRRKCALFKITDGALYYIGAKQGMCHFTITHFFIIFII